MKKQSFIAKGFLAILIGLSLATAPLMGSPEEYQLSSPDGKLNVQVTVQDKILYSVK